MFINYYGKFEIILYCHYCLQKSLLTKIFIYHNFYHLIINYSTGYQKRVHEATSSLPISSFDTEVCGYS